MSTRTCAEGRADGNGAKRELLLAVFSAFLGLWASLGLHVPAEAQPVPPVSCKTQHEHQLPELLGWLPCNQIFI